VLLYDLTDAARREGPGLITPALRLDAGGSSSGGGRGTGSGARGRGRAVAAFNRAEHGLLATAAGGVVQVWAADLGGIAVLAATLPEPLAHSNGSAHKSLHSLPRCRAARSGACQRASRPH
jgi:hypothetical protein